MTTVSERLRSAAIGPAPKYWVEIARSWVGIPANYTVGEYSEATDVAYLAGLTEDDIRTFLCFVACAVEDEQ